jgi:hypothetical protein
VNQREPGRAKQNRISLRSGPQQPERTAKASACCVLGNPLTGPSEIRRTKKTGVVAESDQRENQQPPEQHTAMPKKNCDREEEQQSQKKNRQENSA